VRDMGLLRVGLEVKRVAETSASLR